MSVVRDEPTEPNPRRRAWLVWPVAAVGYFLMTCLATWPVVTRFGAAIPGELTDPLEHLWIMRWLRSCLLDGRNPLFCPFLQAPVGVPLGYFPTLHLQTILYLIARLVTANDAAIFTAIWFLGFVATGLASFGLARWALPGLGAGVAWVAGLGVMLCGPMLMHAHGHLETMQLGVFPPFLIAWMRFNDRPGRGRLAWAVMGYLVLVAAAPYFAVLAIFPAVGYSAWSGGIGPDSWRRGRRLAPWLVGFGVVALPGVAFLFGAQIWADRHGFAMSRSKRIFDQFGAPPWSSFVPSTRHALGSVVAPRLFEGNGHGPRMTEVSSYLGLVALGLLGYAAWKQTVFPRRGFWWSLLASLVVLSWGSRQELFGASVSLPAGWIYGVFPPFHLIRVPARFNLFAAAVAVVPVAAALRDLIRRWRSPPARGTLLAILAAATVADLAMVPFPTAEIPDPPPIYATIRRRQPDARILDAPLFDSTRGQTFASLWGYWQQRTGLATSGGYPGLTNTRFDAEVAQPSVFSAARLGGQVHDDFGRDGTQNVHDRAWLELSAHGFDYAVLHWDAAASILLGLRIDWNDRARQDGPLRLLDHLGEGIIDQSPDEVVFSRSRLRPPGSLTWLTDDGWRPVPAPRGAPTSRSAALRAARVVVYQPSPGPIVLRLGRTQAYGGPRTVSLVEADGELARWSIEPGPPRDLATPPIPLSAGLHTWMLRSSGASAATRSADRLDDANTPYSFRLDQVHLEPAEPVR